MTTIKIADKELDISELEVLAKHGFLTLGQKNDPASTTLPAAQLHGRLHSNTGYGVLSGAGVRPQMLSAMAVPESVAGVLPLVGSENYNENIEIHTGVTTETGTNATGWCGNPPANGALKVCRQVYNFGKYYIKTDLEAVAEIGQRKDYADVPRDILNAPNAGADFPLVPEAAFLGDTRSDFRYQMWLAGIAAIRDWSHVAIQGNSALASTNTQHGWIQEFAGLDGQIKTGYTDSVTGVTCPAADSVVETHNADISATSGGRSFTQAMQDIAWALEARAAAMNMSGVQWIIVMRRELFYRACEELAANTPTSRMANLDTGTAFVNPQQAAFEQFLRGRYLTIMGRDWPVIIDDGVPQETLANQTYKSDIFFVPLYWAGRPLTYMQYFNMNNQYSLEYTNAFGLSEVKRSNNGLWLVGKRDTGLCIEYHLQAKARLILEFPPLAGRLDDVWYTYKPQTRDGVPGASLYANGGVSKSEYGWVR